VGTATASTKSSIEHGGAGVNPKVTAHTSAPNVRGGLAFLKALPGLGTLKKIKPGASARISLKETGEMKERNTHIE
jgi:hypothetical protein